MPHDISIKTLQKFIDKVQWAKVVQKASTASKGQRLYPSRTPANDSSANFRIDKGSDVDGKSELVLQANKNAEDRKVKEAAQKDSHAILAKGLADSVNDPSGNLTKEELVADFKSRK